MMRIGYQIPWMPKRKDLLNSRIIIDNIQNKKKKRQYYYLEVSTSFCGFPMFSKRASSVFYKLSEEWVSFEIIVGIPFLLRQ